jgi:hypothetical protein
MVYWLEYRAGPPDDLRILKSSGGVKKMHDGSTLPEQAGWIGR